MSSRLPIRWRLTFWYALLLTLALVTASGIFYFGLRHFLLDSLETTLEHQAAIIDDSVTVTNGELSLTANNATGSDDDQFVLLTDAAGNVIVDTSTASEDLSGDFTGLSAALGGQTLIRWVDTGDDRVRILSRPVIRNSEIVGALQVGIESDIDDTLSFALQSIAIAVPLILLIAVGGGVWLAGRALEPVDRIARTAADIEAHDLSRRIDFALPDDEVGRLADTFNAMLDRIERAFDQQRQFTADAAHELRTPLALLLSRIDLALARPDLPDNERSLLEALKSDGDRLTRISRALLSLARSDAYGMQLTREPIDVRELLELIAEQYGALAQSRELEITVDAEPAHLNADRDQLIQVLVNLVDNAMRHAPAGTRVNLSCRQSDQFVTIRVADQGPGIAPEHLPRLFDRFYRVEADRDRRHGGAGLGLSISRTIVEAHGGAIEVESVPGEGTTFTVILPRSG